MKISLKRASWYYPLHNDNKLANREIVTTDTLAKICKALHCTADDIMKISFDEEVSVD